VGICTREYDIMVIHRHSLECAARQVHESEVVFPYVTKTILETLCICDETSLIVDIIF
jgi:hypothetical protein